MGTTALSRPKKPKDPRLTAKTNVALNAANAMAPTAGINAALNTAFDRGNVRPGAPALSRPRSKDYSFYEDPAKVDVTPARVGIPGAGTMIAGMGAGLRAAAAARQPALSRPSRPLTQSTDPVTAGNAQDAVTMLGGVRAVNNVTSGRAQWLDGNRTSAGGVAGVAGDTGSVAPLPALSRPRTAANNAYGSAPIEGQAGGGMPAPALSRPMDPRQAQGLMEWDDATRQIKRPDSRIVAGYKAGQAGATAATNIVADAADIGLDGAAPITQKDVMDRMRGSGMNFEQARQAVLADRRAMAQQQQDNDRAQQAADAEGQRLTGERQAKEQEQVDARRKWLEQRIDGIRGRYGPRNVTDKNTRGETTERVVTPEMSDADKAMVQQLEDELARLNQGGKGGDGSSAQTAMQITTREEFQKLPSGTWVIDPSTGRPVRKK